MVYRLILKARNRAYDKGRRSSTAAAVPTICVGNVAVGGTGKTPHTEMILRLLTEGTHEGEAAMYKAAEVAVLSRGYMRCSKGFQFVLEDSSASFAGDEPLQIKRKFPDVTVAVDKDRVNGCGILAEDEKAKAKIIVLDDAFQYRKLKASLNIVLIDFNRPPQEDKLLPWGRLRDLPERINDADIIIVTKCPSGLDEFERRAFTRALNLKKDIPVLYSYIDYQDLKPVFPEGDGHFLYSPEAVVFSGVAKDRPFREYVGSKYKLKSGICFDDHHAYGKKDIRKISAMAAENPRAIVVTTEKDVQKIKDVPDIPAVLKERMFFAPIQAAFITPQDLETLREALKRL